MNQKWDQLAKATQQNVEGEYNCSYPHEQLDYEVHRAPKSSASGWSHSRRIIRKNHIVVVTKLKIELAEPSSSFKATLVAIRALKEKMRQVRIEAEEAKKALKTKMEKEKAEGAKENGKVGEREREKVLFVEVEKCQSSMLRISEDCFHQVSFFHAEVQMAMKDVEGQGENDATPQNESEPSFEELFDPP
ncbi:hypothetical protein ACSQ67_009849 [Phaseolus vulgaris]